MKQFKSEFKCFGVKDKIYVPLFDDEKFDSYLSALHACLSDASFKSYSKFKIVEHVTIEREVCVFTSNVIDYVED